MTYAGAPLDHLALLEAAQSAFARELAGADPEGEIATCAPWCVADLALHLGGVHWWAAAMAMGVDLEGADASRPRARDAVVGFYTWSARHLLDTLGPLGPDAIGRTLDGPGRAAFWRRRQLHETLVHLVDLRLAGGASLVEAGAEPGPDVWADTVDEVVTVMQPRQVRLGRMVALEAPVALVAEDVDGAGRRWALGSADAVGARVTVRGPAWALALLLWRRLSPDDAVLTLDGDRRVLDDALGRALVP